MNAPGQKGNLPGREVFVITYQLPTSHPYFVIASRRRRRSNPHIGQEIASLRSQ